MLCDSNRRLSNTRITAKCQIIYFPLVFPAPEVLKPQQPEQSSYTIINFMSKAWSDYHFM